MNKITVNNKTISIGDIVMTIDGRAKLTYIGRLPFTSWTLIDIRTNLFPFGRQINVEDNNLSNFII